MDFLIFLPFLSEIKSTEPPTRKNSPGTKIDVVAPFTETYKDRLAKLTLLWPFTNHSYCAPLTCASPCAQRQYGMQCFSPNTFSRPPQNPLKHYEPASREFSMPHRGTFFNVKWYTRLLLSGSTNLSFALAKKSLHLIDRLTPRSFLLSNEKHNARSCRPDRLPWKWPLK